eukprot:EG_transcript_8337
MLVVLAAVVFYLCTEDWRWHNNVYIERSYCLAVAAVWGVRYSLGVPSMVGLALLVSVVHDRLQRRTFRPHRYITHNVRSLPRIFPEAEGKTLRLNDVLTAANKFRGLVGGLKQLLDWLVGNSEQYEALIHCVLQGASDDELNFILCCVDLPEVLRFANVSTEDMLVEDARLAALNTPARAALIDALQKKGLPHNVPRQQRVQRIFLATSGREMTLLKSLLDIRKEYHNLHKLIFNDLNYGPIQDAVLAHIHVQGEALARRSLKVISDVDDTLFSSGGRWPAGTDCTYPKGIVYPGVLAFYRELNFGLFAHDSGEDEKPEHVVADPRLRRPSIQVTRMCSGFVNETLGDTHHPLRHRVSMRSSSDSITRAVAHYTGAGRPQSLYRSCGLVFLSARPHLYKDYGGEGHFFKTVIDPLESRQELYTFTALIPGNLSGGAWHVLLTVLGRAGPESWRRVALDKKCKLQQFACLYPECALVFVGDNGQGDLLAAELTVDELGLQPPSSPTSPGGHTGQMLGSFIHDVQPADKTLTTVGHLPVEEREEAYKAKGIHHFKTYVGA